MKQASSSKRSLQLWTDKERLQFVSRFADLDLDTLRPGAWLTLREDLDAFFPLREPEEASAFFPPITWHVSDRLDPMTMPEDAIRALQKDVRLFLKGAPVSPVGVMLPEVPTTVGYIAAFASLHVAGNFRDLFFTQLAFLLRSQPVLRVRQCKECGARFYCRKNQTYCTQTCSNRAAQRRYRARHAPAPS
jgi:hypothetical protein